MTARHAGHIVPDELFNAIIGGAYGSAADMQVPPALLASLSWEETGFRNIQSENTVGPPNILAPNGREASYGWLQLFNQGGLGDGYTEEQLLVTSTNVFLARNAILTRLRAGRSLEASIAAWSTAGAAWAGYLAAPIIEITGF